MGKLTAKTLAVLRRMRVPLDDITAMDYAINVDHQTPEQAADAWFAAHEDVVRSWLIDVAEGASTTRTAD